MNKSHGVLPVAEVSSQSDAIDDLPVAYVEINARGAITLANRLTRQHNSRFAGELIGKLVWELMPAEEQDLSYATFKTAMETGEDPPVTRRSIYTSSENYLVYELHHRLIRDAEGRPTGMRVVSVDVSKTHKAQQEAEQARLWLESVLDALSAAVIVTDTLGLIRTVNPAAEKLFGWKASELIGKEIEKVLPVVSCISNDKEPISFTMELDKCTRGVATMLDRERRELLVEIGSSPIVDQKSGFTTGVVSVLRRLKETEQS